MSSWPKGANLTEVRGGGTNLHPQDEATKDEDNLFSMNGPEVFKYSLPKVYQMILSILKRNQLSQADVDLLIPSPGIRKGCKSVLEIWRV